MRRLRAFVALVLVATGTIAVARPAAAAGPTLALVAHDLVVAPGGTASFTFTVGGPSPPDTEVVVEAYTKLTSARRDLRRLFDGGLHNRDVGFVATSLDLLAPDALGRHTITLPTVVSAQERVQGGNALLPDPGMYPVTVELRANNVALAQISTAIVRTADGDQGAPLDVAFVLPIVGAPTLRADGTTIIDPADRTRLQTIAGVLAETSTSLTLAPEPELMDGLARTGLPADAALRDGLARALSGRQLLASSYVSMDPTAVVRSGLSEELTTQLTEGEEALAAAFPTTSTDRATWMVSGRVGADAVTMLRNLGVRRLVVPAGAVTAQDGQSSTTIVEAGVGGGALPVQFAVADGGFAAAFAAHSDPVLAAYQFVAGLLAISVDQAPATGRQGVVVTPPADWQPDATFLGTVLALLGQNPRLHAVTLDDWFREVASAGGPPRTLAAPEPVDLAGFANGLALTRLRLDSLGSMLPADDPLPASLDLRLRVANSAALAGPARQSYFDAVNGELNRLNDAVDPVATRRITLAGRSTEVPITLHRRIDRPIQVRLHVDSPKLSFPENDMLINLDAETVQTSVSVKARANGTFPLTVSVMTPSGDVAVAPPSELTIHATTLSGFGVVLSAGALLVLATWWVRHLRHSRRRRAVAVALGHHPSTGAPGEPAVSG